MYDYKKLETLSAPIQTYPESAKKVVLCCMIQTSRSSVFASLGNVHQPLWSCSCSGFGLKYPKDLTEIDDWQVIDHNTQDRRPMNSWQACGFRTENGKHFHSASKPNRFFHFNTYKHTKHTRFHSFPYIGQRVEGCMFYMFSMWYIGTKRRKMSSFNVKSCARSIKLSSTSLQKQIRAIEFFADRIKLLSYVCQHRQLNYHALKDLLRDTYHG